MFLDILTEQLFPAKGWRVAATTRETKRVVVDLAPMRAWAICSGCGETKTYIHDVKPARTWRHTERRTPRSSRSKRAIVGSG